MLLVPLIRHFTLKEAMNSRSNVRTIAEMSLMGCFTNEPGLFFSPYPVIITFLVPCYPTNPPPKKYFSDATHADDTRGIRKIATSLQFTRF